MNIFMHRLCSVVTHYIQHVSAKFFYKPVFIIDCTRRKIVNMRTKVPGVSVSRIIRVRRWFCFVSGALGGLL